MADDRPSLDSPELGGRCVQLGGQLISLKSALRLGSVFCDPPVSALSAFSSALRCFLGVVPEMLACF